MPLAVSAILRPLLRCPRVRAERARSQFVWPIVTDKLLSCNSTYQYVDHVAVSPYFGDSQLYLNPNTTVDELMESVIPESIASQVPLLQQHYNMSASRNVSLITYEAGFGGIGDGSATDLAIAV